LGIEIAQGGLGDLAIKKPSIASWAGKTAIVNCSLHRFLDGEKKLN